MHINALELLAVSHVNVLIWTNNILAKAYINQLVGHTPIN